MLLSANHGWVLGPVGMATHKVLEDFPPIVIPSISGHVWYMSTQLLSFPPYLVGGFHPEKYEFVSWDDEMFP